MSVDISGIVRWVDYFREHPARTATEYAEPAPEIRIQWLNPCRRQPPRLAVQTRNTAILRAVQAHYAAAGLANAMGRKQLVLFVPVERLLSVGEPGAWEKVVDSINYLLDNRHRTVNGEERPVKDVCALWYYTGETFWLKIFGPPALIEQLLATYQHLKCWVDNSAEVHSNIPYPGYHYVYPNESWTKLIIAPDN